MILLLDNHDSFTWNLVELFRSIGKNNLKIVTPEAFDISSLPAYERIIFSPGPGLPGENRTMSDILRHASPATPILGVCLGMQAIAEFHGARLYNLPEVVHGQTRNLKIQNPVHPLFKGVPDGTPVGLYHSWAVERDAFPECLNIIATTGDGIIMAIAHKFLPVWGVQFHPESIMTPLGKRMIANWIGEPEQGEAES